MSCKKKLGLRFCIFPGYRWCGPGCGGPGRPINDVDAACKAHDRCYKKYGPCCKCDCLLLRSLRKKANTYTKKGRQALLLYEYMRLQTKVTCGLLNKKR